MSCENLVTAAAFQSEIKKLKAEIAALKTAGLNPTQQKEAGLLAKNVVGPLVNGAVALYAASKIPGVVDAAVRANQGKVISLAERRAAKVAAAKLRPLEKAVSRVEGKLGRFVGDINRRLAGLTGKIARYGDDIIRNSRFLSSLRNSLNGLLRKLAPFLRKIAPFLRILDFFLTGYSIYQLVQLTRRMSNAERAIFALQAGLGLAGARALRALTRIDQIEAMNNRNAASIKGLIRSEHRQTRNSVNGNVNSEHRTTRVNISGVNTTVRNQHSSTRSHVSYEHRVTRTGVTAVNTTVRNQHSSTRSHVSYEHRITRNAIFAIPARIGQTYQNVSKEVVDWNKRNLLPKLNGIQSKLDQTYNKLVDRFNKLWDYMKMDRILNVINTAASVHNAAMLSKNLVESLVFTVDGLIQLIGLKNPDGQPFQLSSQISQGIRGMLENILGQDTVQDLNENWHKLNRIITAGSAVVMAVQAVQWSIAEGVEIIGDWLAKIGNGLREGGAVSDRQWPWMKEGIKIKNFSAVDKFTDALQTAEDVTNNIYATVASGVEIKETVNELRATKQNFDNTLAQETTQADQDLDTRNEESEAGEIDPSDLVKVEAE